MLILFQNQRLSQRLSCANQCFSGQNSWYYWVPPRSIYLPKALLSNEYKIQCVHFISSERHISKKRCFKKYSWIYKTCQFWALYGISWRCYLEKRKDWRQVYTQTANIYANGFDFFKIDRILQHERLRQVKMYISLFLFHHLFLSSIYISLMLWEITEAVARRCSSKKVFLEISQNSQENTCARVSFLINLQAWDLQLH